MQLLTYASHNPTHAKLQRWDRAEGSIGQQLYLPPLRSSIGLQGAPLQNPNPTSDKKSQPLPQKQRKDTAQSSLPHNPNQPKKSSSAQKPS